MSYLGDLGKQLLPSLLAFGTGMITNIQLVKKAKGEANDAKALAELQYNTALAEERRVQALLGSKKDIPEEKKSNTGLYIGLGVGAVVLIGGIIFAVTRK